MKALIEWIAKWLKSRQSETRADFDSLAHQSEGLNDRLSKRLDDAWSRLDKMQLEMDAVHQRESECQVRLSQAEARLAALECR